MSDARDTLRRLPKVDDVLRGPELVLAVARGEVPRWAVVDAVRTAIGRLRDDIRDGRGAADAAAAVGGAADGRLRVDAAAVLAAARRLAAPTLHRVINATGVVLHTNLGRAPLPAASIERIAAVAAGYSNLEYRLDEGKRGSRQEPLAALLAGVTGAEAHLVVNNNAAAVLLMLAGLCAGREVIVSRGELVEIGGSFRVPDVMRASGATLREVGTTNRTHLRDFTGAIGDATRALLKVHRGNFALVGFVKEVPLAELVACARERGLLCLYDLGSGALLPSPVAEPDAGAGAGAETPADDLPDDGRADTAREPTVPDAVAAGCDVVSFSCDKLLGGPQAGVLAGTRASIDALRQHPLLRALRPDKLSLAALAATLELYRDGRTDEIPVLRMLAATPAVLHARAERLRALLGERGVPALVLPVRSAVGGGAMPLSQPPSWAVSPSADARTSRRLEAALRTPPAGVPPVVARLVDGRLLCDVRTVAEGELEGLAGALAAALRAADPA